MLRWIFIVWVALGLPFLLIFPAHAGDLALIKARGELVVGVKADYRPFGFRDTKGELAGLEVDIAAKLADLLDVKLRLAAVTSSDRLQKLASGDVDILVATLGDTIDRRRLVRMIEPGYYGGGASGLLPRDSAIVDWADLKGRELCAVQGALWNRLAATRLLAEIRAFGSVRDAELALRDGGCAGWIYDEAAIQDRLSDADWADYRMLAPEFISPWAIAVAKDGPLASFLDQTVANWLRTGFLSQLEAKWQLQPSTYLQQTEALWGQKNQQGEWLCQLDENGRWPLECRDLDLIKAQDIQGIGTAIIALRDKFNVDLTPFYDPFSRTAFLKAMLTTFLLAVAAVFGSLAVGILGGAMLRSSLWVLRLPAHLLTTFFRMTPPLLQLYLVFFGIGGLLAARGLTLDAIWVAIVVLSLYAGASNAIAISEASAAIPAAASGRLRRIAALAFPAVMGSCINIVKATAMASAIAVGELVHASTSIIADYGNVGVMMNILLICYVLLVIAVVFVFSLFEKKVLER